MNIKNKHKFLILIFLLGFSQVFSQENATTSKGRKVILFNNKTWEYADSASDNDTASVAAINQNLTGSAARASGGNFNAQNAQVPSTPPAEQKFFTPQLLITIGIAVLILAGVLGFFLVVQPARKRKVYMKAFQILETGETEQYDEAIELLEKAVLGGLKSNISNEVFFGLAFAKIQLGKTEEAYADIQRISDWDSDSLYLKLFILYKKKSYKEVHEFFEKNFSSLESKRQSKEIVSIACIELGKDKYKKQLHEQAIPYFAMVRKLKVYAKYIPENVSNIQVTLGIQALYNKDFDQAVDLFTKARNKAIEENQNTVDCDLGLVLCEWNQDNRPDLENRILEIINLAHKNYNDVHPFESKVPESGNTQVTERHILISNIYLLYGISYIYTWFRLPESKGLPEEKIREIHARLDKAFDYNPQQTDTDFILGLIDFYFDENANKEAAINRIEKSGVNLPDIIQLIKSQKEAFEKVKKVIERYILLARGYISDRKIPVEFRNELKERLTRYEKFKKAAELAGEKPDSESETATLQEIQARSKITRKHINDILRNKFKDMNREMSENFSDLINDINDTSELISNSTRSLEKTEHLLMLNTGEYLLEEDLAAKDNSENAGETDKDASGSQTISIEKPA